MPQKADNASSESILLQHQRRRVEVLVSEAGPYLWSKSRPPAYQDSKFQPLRLATLNSAFDVPSVTFSILPRQRKLASALRAFGHAALDNRGAAAARKRSAITHVESESALWAVYDVFRLSHDVTLFVILY